MYAAETLIDEKALVLRLIDGEMCIRDRAGLDVPLLIGGATTSPLHTALKIAPVYHAPVILSLIHI